MSATMRVSTTAISRTVSVRRRPAARGWGQGIRLEDGRMSWPTGSPTRGERFDDPIDDQIRHAIAWSEHCSADLARAAGIAAATLDRFMRGYDALTLGQAAKVAALLGLRLLDQGMVEGLARFWEKAGRPAISCPPNRLEATAWSRARRPGRAGAASRRA